MYHLSTLLITDPEEFSKSLSTATIINLRTILKIQLLILSEGIESGLLKKSINSAEPSREFGEMNKLSLL